MIVGLREIIGCWTNAELKAFAAKWPELLALADESELDGRDFCDMADIDSEWADLKKLMRYRDWLALNRELRGMNAE